MSVLTFPSQPGRPIATIEIIRTPDGNIGARLVDMSVAEIEAEDDIAGRFRKVVGWLDPVADSLIAQAAQFEEPQP